MSTLVNRTVEVSAGEWTLLHPKSKNVARSEAPDADKQVERRVTVDNGKHNKAALSRCGRANVTLNATPL